MSKINKAYISIYYNIPEMIIKSLVGYIIPKQRKKNFNL